MTLRAACLIRMSTDRQAASPDRQRAGFQEYCTRFALTPAGEYLEEAVSATSTALADRDAVTELVAAAKRKLFDVVWIEEPSRLARRPEDWFAVRAALGRYGVAIVGPGDDPALARDTAIAEFTQGLFALLARFEARQFGDRVSRAQRVKVSTGGYRGGPLPPGLAWTGTAWALDADRQPIAEMAFRAFLEHRNLETVAAILNAAGYVTRLGNAFGGKAVRHILHSPVYRGRVGYGGEQWPANLPEILDPALVAAVDLVLTRRVAQGRGADTSRHATFAGLLRCPDCGGTLTTCMDRTRRRDGSHSEFRVRYFCRRGRRQPCLCPNRRYLSQYRLDAELVPSLLAELKTRLRDLPGPEQTRRPDRRAAQERRLEEERTRVLGLHVRGMISEEECDRLLASVAERRARLGAPDVPMPVPTRRELQVAVRSLEAHWRRWQPPERRAWLQAVLESITLDLAAPSESTPHWRA